MLHESGMKDTLRIIVSLSFLCFPSPGKSFSVRQELVRPTQGHDRHHRMIISNNINNAAMNDVQESEIEKKEIVSSNFWNTIVRKGNESDVRQRIPFVATLDRDGPLPEGAYLYHGDPRNGVKETCRLSIALDAPSIRYTLKMMELTSEPVVAKMQRLVDSGFTTFQIKTPTEEHQRWTEEQVLGRFRSDTPHSVVDRCHITIPMTLKSLLKMDSLKLPSQIRQSVCESLARIGGEAIDCIQIKVKDSEDKKSPYLFEMMDTLMELKREGLVHSLSGYNMPSDALQVAKQYDFIIDWNQHDMNLLHSTFHYNGQKRLFQELRIPSFISNPLAGGLLTDRYLNRSIMPNAWEFRPSERLNWNTQFYRWARDRDRSLNSFSVADPTLDARLWKLYQSELLATLDTIALKHRTSIAAVALRWGLQLDTVASSVVSCRLVYPDDGMNRKPRQEQLRQVFRFELDKEDMEILWKLTGQTESLNQLETDNKEDISLEMLESASGLVLPTSKGDSSSRMLWL